MLLIRNLLMVTQVSKGLFHGISGEQLTAVYKFINAQ
jgi:hypothetical protein